ncbi:hypothetical protein GCM10009096_00620 [Parasphingorhabdus litoris]|uniref:Uncharacterized protein n=1 Tax=Parasphingorhabdus litoris TaxID=394733 RepID=A0ABN0ZZU6_9SPHN|nr:hypothetical protein [Parasphingorhabdus litoris]
MVNIIKFLLPVLALGLSGPAYAARTQGPLMSPLKVNQIYMTDGNAVFVLFQDGSMPTCYANRGGYLRKSHPNFDQLYAQLLMIIATNGSRGNVIFDTINPNAGQWGDCDIAGIYLRPE